MTGFWNRQNSRDRVVVARGWWGKEETVCEGAIRNNGNTADLDYCSGCVP